MTTKSTTTKTTSKPKAEVVKGPSQTLPNLPKNPFVFEILDVVSKQKTKAKKIAALKKYEEVPLKTILIWNFDESVVSALPPGDVPYSQYDEQTTQSGTLSTKLTEEIRRMHETGSFSLGVSDQQGRTTIRRESMFINLLEGLHPLEAEIMCLVKDKKLSDMYNITQEIVSEAYPDIKWGGRS